MYLAPKSNFVEYITTDRKWMEWKAPDFSGYKGDNWSVVDSVPVRKSK